MSKIYEAIKEAERSQPPRPALERTDRELLNELGAAVGRLEYDLAVIARSETERYMQLLDKLNILETQLKALATKARKRKA